MRICADISAVSGSRCDDLRRAVTRFNNPSVPLPSIGTAEEGICCASLAGGVFRWPGAPIKSREGFASLRGGGFGAKQTPCAAPARHECWPIISAAPACLKPLVRGQWGHSEMGEGRDEEKNCYDRGGETVDAEGMNERELQVQEIH